MYVCSVNYRMRGGILHAVCGVKNSQSAQPDHTLQANRPETDRQDTSSPTRQPPTQRTEDGPGSTGPVRLSNRETQLAKKRESTARKVGKPETEAGQKEDTRLKRQEIW